MAWVTAAIAVAGLVAGAYSANKSAQGQKNALNAQKKVNESDQEFRNRQYTEQKSLYGPLEEQSVQDAMAEGPLDYGLTSGSINRNFDSAQRRIATNPNLASGLSASAARGIELNRAATLSGAYQSGLAAKRQYRQSVLSGSGIRGAATAVENGNQNNSNYLGGLSSMYGGAAQGGWSSAANGLSSLATMFGSGQGSTQAPQLPEAWRPGNVTTVPVPSASVPSEHIDKLPIGLGW